MRARLTNRLNAMIRQAQTIMMRAVVMIRPRSNRKGNRAGQALRRHRAAIRSILQAQIEAMTPRYR